MAKRGRPRKDNAKRNFVGFRLEEHEVASLDALCAENRMTRTDLVREGIELFREKNRK